MSDVETSLTSASRADVAGTEFTDWLIPRRGHNDLPRVAWRTGDLIGALVFLAIWRGVVLLLQSHPERVHDLVALLIGAGVPLIAVAVYPVWAYRRGGGGWPVRWPSFSRWLTELSLTAPTVFLMFCGIAALSIAWKSQVGEAPAMDERMQEIAFSGNPWLLAVMAVGACLWAPMAEELFFRGFLQNALSQRMPVPAAAILQTIVFALVHPYTGLHLVAILLIGAGLTLHYLWRKTLIATMCLHAVFNGVMLLLVGAVMALAAQAPVLGVQLDATAERCRIAGVYEGSGADVGGLAGGDVIVEFDGQPVSNMQALQLLLLGRQSGEEVPVVIERDGQRLELSVPLSPRQPFKTLIREAVDGAR